MVAVDFLVYMFRSWSWLFVQAVLFFEERLRRVHDLLRKEKEAHASSRAELELCNARVAEL